MLVETEEWEGAEELLEVNMLFELEDDAKWHIVSPPTHPINTVYTAPAHMKIANVDTGPL